MAKSGVILCECHGMISNRLSFSGVSQFLGQREPEVGVLVCDDICRSKNVEAIARDRGWSSVVIGACSRAIKPVRFWEEVGDDGYDPYAIRVVDLLKEIETSYSETETIDRAKLLLLAQIKRVGAFEGIRQENLKLHFGDNSKRMNRRRLLSMTLPHYEVIPFINLSKCASQHGCHICVDACPIGAIVVEEQRITVDMSKCRACGACAVICPHHAISYPTFSVEELASEIEGLLASEAPSLEPRIIAMVCQGCLADFDRKREGSIRYPSNVLPLKVTCLAMVSSWLMLHAFHRKAQGIVLVSAKGKCPSGFGSETWQENIGFVQELLSCWNVEPQRIKQIQVEESNTKCIQQQLGEFAENIVSLPRVVLGQYKSTEYHSGELSLSKLIESLGAGSTCCAKDIISTGNVPFGMVTLNTSQCTACGLCVLNCPAEALTIYSTDEESGMHQLLFRHEQCIACHRCVESCPENCISVKHVLDLSQLGSSPKLLMEYSLLRCSKCEMPLGPLPMIDKIGRGELCPNCAIRAELSLA